MSDNGWRVVVCDAIRLINFTRCQYFYRRINIIQSVNISCAILIYSEYVPHINTSYECISRQAPHESYMNSYRVAQKNMYMYYIHNQLNTCKVQM